MPDEIVDRFCVLGEPADEHVAKLGELRDAGMDQFAIYLMHDAPEATLDAYGAEVIPAFAEAHPAGHGQPHLLGRALDRAPEALHDLLDDGVLSPPGRARSARPRRRGRRRGR